MSKAKDGYLLAKKDPETGTPLEPVGFGMTGEPAVSAIALFDSIEVADAARSGLPSMSPLYIFKVHMVIVGEVLSCNEES
jgi:hypothetical protein